MKNALLLSGKPTALLECYPSIYRNIIRPNNCDVFLQMWWKDGWINKRSRTDRDAYKVEILEDTINLAYSLYNPVQMIVEEPRGFPDYYNSIYQPNDQNFVQSIQSMFCSWMQVNNLKLDHETEMKQKYHMVGRMRYDLYIDSPIIFKDLNRGFINIFDDCKHEAACVNDHITVCSSENMDIFCDIYNHYDRLYNEKKCPFCSEVFIGRWLQENKIKTKGMDARYFMWRQMENYIYSNLNTIKEF